MLLAGCDSCTKPESDNPGLLTDEEMLTEEDPGAPEEDPRAPEEDPNWTDWIIANNIPIRSLESRDYSDLREKILMAASIFGVWHCTETLPAIGRRLSLNTTPLPTRLLSTVSISHGIFNSMGKHVMALHREDLYTVGP